MSSEANERVPYKIVEDEERAYRRREVPEADSDWPGDVRAVYEEIRSHLFDIDRDVSDAYTHCGIGNNNISSRFCHFVGQTPNDFVMFHRMEFAKRLIRYEELSVSQIAFAVGYATPNGFSTMFKRREGMAPTAFEKKILKDDEM